MSQLISNKFTSWQAECESRFQQLKANEEELNRIFIDIYGLQDELTPDVADKDVTVHRVFDSKDDVPESMKGSNYVRTMRDEIVSLISYAVGCMFGRYSLDVEGLAYAGGEWDDSKYKTYIPDEDNCIPVTDVEYFKDDIVGRFVEFVRTVYGEDTLEENLKFVADALGGKGATSREIIRNYFLNDFIKDHIKTYQKRPIYWMFDSGKQNGFKALIYMQRYDENTIGRIRADYLFKMQRAYSDACTRFEKRLFDLETTRLVSIQMAPQIRLLQQADQEIVDKLRSNVINTIPLWRNQMVLALGIEHSRRALDAQSAITEMTNEMFRVNAETLRQGAIDAAAAAERAVVDVETLKVVNQEIIKSINEVVRIHEEGTKRRMDAQNELAKIEDELKAALLEAGSR